jgi:hypothetical protein|tara:strand:- start:248 stop:652 length:405 start_codon:yes stop_codon:yes gene_type:complete
MAQSLENRFEGQGSRLGYPNNPSQPIATGVVSVRDRLSSLHDLYSYDGDPPASDVAPIYSNTRLEGVTALPEPTQLQAFTGPQNTGATAAGFETYNNQQTYDDFILAQGSNDGRLAANRFQGTGDAFLSTNRGR